MIECTGDLWTEVESIGPGPLCALLITTNGSVNKQGLAVMGRGIAKEAAEKFPTLRKDLGRFLKAYGQNIWAFNYGTEYDLYTFPVKHKWFEKADLKLIEVWVNEFEHRFEPYDYVYLPRPGCGNGHLDWADVKPFLVGLPDKYLVYTKQTKGQT